MGAGARQVRSSLFRVRVWPEDVGDGLIEWRGKVQRVPGGETIYFHDWETLLAFLTDVHASQPVSDKKQEES